MALLALLRVTARQTWTQPALLFALTLQILLLGALAFGLQITYEAGEMSGMKLFSLTIEEPLFFVRASLPPLAGLTLGLLMFLLIVGTGSLYTEYLSDPLLDVILTRMPSRTLFLLTRLCGIWTVLLLDLLLFAGSLWMLLAYKTGGMGLPGLFTGALLFCVQAFVISAFCALLGILTENTTGVIIIGLSLQFLLGNAGGLLDSARHPAWQAVTFLLPRTYELNRMTLGAFFGEGVTLLPLLGSLAQIVLCTAAAVAFFTRRDL